MYFFLPRLDGSCPQSVHIRTDWKCFHRTTAGRQHYSCLSQWQLLGPMALQWIAPSPTPYYCIKGIKHYEEFLLLCLKRHGSVFARLHLGIRHYSTKSHQNYSCGTKWPVGNETLHYTGEQHRLQSVKDVLLHFGHHRLDPRHDGRLLCHCRSHVSSLFWPPEDMVQDFPFANEENDDTGHDYLCPRTQTPVRPIITRPSNLHPLDIPRQVVVLPPLLTRKVGARLSLFCDVWRRRRCSEWKSISVFGSECPP